MADLRGTGAIGEDAAAVMLIYYDSADLKAAKSDDSGQRMKTGPIKTWLKIGKNRYGPQQSYDLLLHHMTETRFEFAGKEKEEPA